MLYICVRLILQLSANEKQVYGGSILRSLAFLEQALLYEEIEYQFPFTRLCLILNVNFWTQNDFL